MHFPPLRILIVCLAVALGAPSARSDDASQCRDGKAASGLGEICKGAARQAANALDAAAASLYYRAALRYDPKNVELLQLAFYAALADGDIDEASRLAQRLIEIDRNHVNAHLVLGVKMLKAKSYKEARSHFGQGARGAVADLTATLLGAWSAFGANDSKGAVDTIGKLTGPEWYDIFKYMHAGLILDLANNKEEAAKRLEHSYKLDPSALRVMQAYGDYLSRNGGKDEALKMYGQFDRQLPRYPLVVEAMAALRDDEKLPRMVVSAQSGAAEALYGLGAALGRREEKLSINNRGLAYLQLALYLDPNHALAKLALADLYEAMKKPELAINVYERVPANSPLRRNAEIQLGIDLDALGRTDEAKKRLDKLIASKPDDLDALLALGNIMRERKQYVACADAYTKGLNLEPNPTRTNWTTYYFRGICYERNKQWANAEADMKKALELYPEQPHVLNYLGYSWIDRGIHLDEAMSMIKRALEQRPDDGYIVGSLGWAFFRLSNFDEAVRNLERATKLKPEDPTLKIQLGDAYWRVERKVDANAQWVQARDLNSSRNTLEPDELADLENKLSHGMTAAPQNAVLKEQPDNVRPRPAAASAATNAPAVHTERRVALVIGNSSYRNVSWLANPKRDAEAVASALRTLGFQTVALEVNLSREQILNALRSFAIQAEQADWALVYFAGHGIEMSGMNYLIPVDATLAADRDVSLEAVALDQVLNAIDGAKKLRLVLLDACRDNPFLNKMRRTIASRSIGRGLARIEPDPGTLVVYAAKHGEGFGRAQSVRNRSFEPCSHARP
jgi:Flp pilus assembly protein TadD